jgi:hypothetical protein
VRAERLISQAGFASKILGSPLRGSNKFITTLTQGSQSLALGLVLTAASQLVGRMADRDTGKFDPGGSVLWIIYG